MTDIDALLAKLREEPPPLALASIEFAVLDELGRRSTVRPIGAGAMSLAAALAMVVGIASSVIPSGPVEATPLSPFGVSPTLAPSTLLDVR